jgi:hypothetical protein
MRLFVVSTCLLWLLPVAVAKDVVVPFRFSTRLDTTFSASLRKQPPVTCIRGGGADVFQVVSPYWSSFSKLVKEKTKLVQQKVEDGSFWESLRKFVEKQGKAAKERHQTLQEEPEEALELLNVGRIMKLGVTAWILAELLHHLGCFDNPSGVGPKLAEVWKEHAEGPVAEIKHRIKMWWTEERRYGGLFHFSTYQDSSLLLAKFQGLPRRYQFAVGAGTGMILSPILWSVAMRAVKIIGCVYLFAELNEHWKATSPIGESVVELMGFRGSGGENINELLETIRDFVHCTVSNPTSLWVEAQEGLRDYAPGVGMPASAKQGFLLGTIIGVIVV